MQAQLTPTRISSLFYYGRGASCFLAKVPSTAKPAKPSALLGELSGPWCLCEKRAALQQRWLSLLLLGQPSFETGLAVLQFR